MQVSYIDLLQTHDIEFGDLDQVNAVAWRSVVRQLLQQDLLYSEAYTPQVVNETLPALQQLKQTGLVRHIGITGLPLKIFPAVLDRLARTPSRTATTIMAMGCAVPSTTFKNLPA